MSHSLRVQVQVHELGGPGRRGSRFWRLERLPHVEHEPRRPLLQESKVPQSGVSRDSVSEIASMVVGRYLRINTWTLRDIGLT